MLTDGLGETFERLRQEGVRITPQRQAVLEYLNETESHPTAEDVYNHVRERFRGISLATVYNILHLYRDLGIVMELNYGDTSSRFDGNYRNHYHIQCSVCGRLVDYHRSVIQGLEEEAEEATGFRITHHRLEFLGVCPDCSSREKQ